MTRPLRIAFLLPHLRAGGAERVVLNWIGALDRARYRPELMLTRIEGAFLDLLPRDVTPIAIGASRALHLPRYIAGALARHEIDVAYSATNAMNLALLAAPVRGTARIISEHTPPDAYLAEAKWRWFRQGAMRRLYPRSDAIGVPTDAIGRALAATLGRALPVHTLPNPVIAGITRQPARPLRSHLHVVSAGRLVAAKGFDTLIAAIADTPAAHLTIYGEGPLRAALAAQVARLGIADRVALPGHNDTLPAAIADADLFVLASRREGFGNVLIEAMAVGTPVLSTRSDGPQSFLIDGVNGFLVAADDPAALATRLAMLAADPAHRRSVVEAGYATAQRFDIARSTAALAALIDRLAAARSTRA